ncbi:GNAT family N-acetyltransferase [Intrasporangium sp.]|uniref:GNAT family N-acetyltransferase n=1 Tax=Intrasporangium sp. TaxID=1925024 RepID=UPI003221F081
MIEQAGCLAGTSVVRALTPGDTETVGQVVGRMSERSVYLRFHAGLGGGLKPRMAAALARVAPGSRAVLVADVDGVPVGLAHVARLVDGSQAEVALAVADAWQGRGVGRHLAMAAAQVAHGWGVPCLVAVVLPEHRSLRGWLQRLGAVADPDDLATLRIPLAAAVRTALGPRTVTDGATVLQWHGAGPGARSGRGTARGGWSGRAAG